MGTVTISVEFCEHWKYFKVYGVCSVNVFDDDDDDNNDSNDDRSNTDDELGEVRHA